MINDGMTLDEMRKANDELLEKIKQQGADIMRQIEAICKSFKEAQE